MDIESARLEKVDFKARWGAGFVAMGQDLVT